MSSIGFAKIVCLQCSDHVCAKDSSSISVGFLFNLVKCSFMTFIEDKSSARGPLRLPVSSIIPSLPIFISSSSETAREIFMTDFLFSRTTLGTFMGRFIFPDFTCVILAFSIKGLYKVRENFFTSSSLCD